VVGRNSVATRQKEGKGGRKGGGKSREIENGRTQLQMMKTRKPFKVKRDNELTAGRQSRPATNSPAKLDYRIASAHPRNVKRAIYHNGNCSCYTARKHGYSDQAT